MKPTGVVHFGPGAFHRAHQADYFDRLQAADPRWSIAAVSLRTPGTVDALERQNGRYTLAIVDAEPSFRTLDVHNRFFGPGESAGVRAALADPNVRIVSSTVTEKGYCLKADGTLDFAHRDIVQDLASPDQPQSIIGWISLGLGDRRSAGLPAFSIFCCDNMVSNGRKLGAAVTAFARARDPELAAWIEGEARFPNAMVDSIVPATTDALRRAVAEAGFDDSIPVGREAYSAWIIEDCLPPEAPDLAGVGAVVTRDVAEWERAKLRVLNGAHSTLAYLGLLRGDETVADAMSDQPLAQFVERLIRDDIIPSLGKSPIDLGQYARDVLTRFRNPAIGHRLAQIAWDGSQKLRYRLFDTISDAIVANRPLDRLAVPVAGWIMFIEQMTHRGEALTDPLAPELQARASLPDAVDQMLQMETVFPRVLAEHRGFRDAVFAAVRRLHNGDGALD